MLGDQIRCVREINGWTQSTLAKKIGVQQSMIALLEIGVRSASDEILSRIASATGYPVEFFTDDLDFEFPLGSHLYRKAGSISSEQKAKSHRLAQQVYGLIKRMSCRLSPIPLKIPKSIDEDIPTAAMIMRSALGYGPDAPIRNLINRLERAGVFVISLPEEIEKLDAFSMWVEGKPLIFLSPDKPGDRQRMSVSHELAHLELHQSGSLEDAEEEANRFAREFLLPTDVMLAEMRPPLTIARLAELKPKWGASLQMMVFRAFDLRIITERQKRYLFMQIAQRGWKTKEPSELEIPIEKPRGLRRMAELLYGDPISYKRFADETHLPIFHLKKIVGVHASKEDLAVTSAKPLARSELTTFRQRE